MKNLIFFLLLALLSCKSLVGIEQNKIVEFDLWKSYVSKLIDIEVVNIPKGCPSFERAPFYKKIINDIDISERKGIIDSLINSNKVSSKQTIIVYDMFIQGFNFYHCTKFAIYDKLDKEIKILEVCRSTLDPALVEEEDSFFEQNILQRSEFLEMLNIESSCNIDGIYIITMVNYKSEIVNCKVALMPN